MKTNETMFFNVQYSFRINDVDTQETRLNIFYLARQLSKTIIHTVLWKELFNNKYQQLRNYLWNYIFVTSKLSTKKPTFINNNTEYDACI